MKVKEIKKIFWKHRREFTNLRQWLLCILLQNWKKNSKLNYIKLSILVVFFLPTNSYIFCVCVHIFKFFKVTAAREKFLIWGCYYRICWFSWCSFNLLRFLHIASSEVKLTSSWATVRMSSLFPTMGYS